MQNNKIFDIEIVIGGKPIFEYSVKAESAIVAISRAEKEILNEHKDVSASDIFSIKAKLQPIKKIIN